MCSDGTLSMSPAGSPIRAAESRPGRNWRCCQDMVRDRPSVLRTGTLTGTGTQVKGFDREARINSSFLPSERLVIASSSEKSDMHSVELTRLRMKTNIYIYIYIYTRERRKGRIAIASRVSL